MMSEQLSKRHNAYSVLPEELIKEIKKHFPAGTLYIPANGKPAEVDRIARAKEIRRRYRVLCNSRLPRKRRAPVKYLAKEFELSSRQIYNILNDPRYLKEDEPRDNE